MRAKSIATDTILKNLYTWLFIKSVECSKEESIILKTEEDTR